MLSRDEFNRRAAEVTALDTQRHAHLIAGLVRWLQPVSCVEVGTYCGGTAVHIARALQENGKGELVCIDDFSLNGEAYHQLWYNLGALGLGDVVSVNVGRSTEPDIWPERVDFAVIDGDHSYEGCRFDVQTAFQRGARCVVVHDVASWWGPRRFLDEVRADLSDPLRIFRKSADVGLLAAGFDGGLAVLLRNEEFPPLQFTEAEYPEGHV